MRHELQHRIQLIQNGIIPQKQSQHKQNIPLWKEIQHIFDQQ